MKNRVIISVGSFTSEDVCNLLENDDSCFIEAYEPRKEVHDRYCKLVKKYPGRLTPINKAVSVEAGKALLNRRTTKSTICPVRSDVPNPFKCEPIEVDVVSIRSILERFDEIDELHINCEGSEIPIILKTDLSLFEKCKFILVQFHDFIPFLSITKEDVKACVMKLLQSFEPKRTVKGSTTYTFRRKW